MWWVLLIIGVGAVIALVVALQRRGPTGITGYQPKGGNEEQLGPPPGLGGGGDAGGGGF
jgi:hypothetical protein